MIMRLICLSKTWHNFPEQYRKYGNRENYEYPVLVGNSYVVYGMIMLVESVVEYYVLGESSRFPSWVPADLFQITDSKLSRHWYFGRNLDGLESTVNAIWGYKELADLSNHFDRLADWDEEAHQIFMNYKEVMELEFPNPAITDTAEDIGEGNWLLCPKCIDAWEVESFDALVRCPKCKTILNNPRYLPLR